MKGTSPHNKGVVGWTNEGSFSKGHAQTNSGRTHWTKELTQSKEFQNKRSGKMPTNDSHRLWRGDSAGYGSKHAWVARKLGTPSKCEHCGTDSAKKFEWANKSGLYTRDLNDWLRLCTKCHHKYDNIGIKAWVTRRANQL